MDRILVIDDDVELCEMLVEYLTPEGFSVDCRHDGESGIDRVLEQAYDLMILDVMLPGMNGFDVLRRIRRQSRLPVIMLTARGDEIDRIVGLELGADDYLAKPFNPRELLARVRAIQRRSQAPPTVASGKNGTSQLSVGDITLDRLTRTVSVDEKRTDLTAVEFSLLSLLLLHAGAVVPREELVRTVLGRPYSPYDRSIDVHVSNLRRKLGPHPDGLERIKAVRGTGYQYTFQGGGGSEAVGD